MTKKTDVPRSLGKPSVCISSIGNCAWICWSSWWYLRRFMGFWLWLNGRMRSQLQYIYNIIIYEIIYDILLWWWSYPSNPISMSQDLAITGDVMAPNHTTTQPPSSGTCPAWSACRCMMSSQCIQPRREEGPQSKAMYVEAQQIWG